MILDILDQSTQKSGPLTESRLGGGVMRALAPPSQCGDGTQFSTLHNLETTTNVLTNRANSYPQTLLGGNLSISFVNRSQTEFKSR